jgi:hypothetical protein
VAKRFGKPLVATSDAHRLHAFGRHFTSMPRPAELTCEKVFAGMRTGPLRLTSPPCTMKDLFSAIYFIFLSHPMRLRKQRGCGHAEEGRADVLDRDKGTGATARRGYEPVARPRHRTSPSDWRA